MILLALVKASVSFGIRPSWYKDHMFRCDAASMLAKSAWAVLSPGSEMNTSISRSRLPIYSLVKFLMPSPPFFSDMKFCVWRRKSSISFCVDKRWAGVYLSFCIGSGTYLHIVERMWLLGKRSCCGGFLLLGCYECFSQLAQFLGHFIYHLLCTDSLIQLCIRCDS